MAQLQKGAASAGSNMLGTIPSKKQVLLEHSGGLESLIGNSLEMRVLAMIIKNFQKTKVGESSC